MLQIPLLKKSETEDGIHRLRLWWVLLGTVSVYMTFAPPSLPSSPAQRLDGCVCVNPGRLTKKAGGGTFARIVMPDLPAAAKRDLSSDVGVQIVNI